MTRGAESLNLEQGGLIEIRSNCVVKYVQIKVNILSLGSYKKFLCRLGICVPVRYAMFHWTPVDGADRDEVKVKTTNRKSTI